jgi:hypothetical protein
MGLGKLEVVFIHCYKEGRALLKPLSFIGEGENEKSEQT